MGLKEIEEKIMAEAELEKKKIYEEAELEKKKIYEEAEKNANIMAARILEEGRNKILLEEKQIIAKAKISTKAKIDKEKAMWLEKVFEEAKREILNLPDKEKKKILENLCDVEGKENFDVFVDKKYKNLLKDAQVEDINDFGVILRSKEDKNKERKIKIDNTLSARIKNLKQNMSSKIAEILFKE